MVLKLGFRVGNLIVEFNEASKSGLWSKIRQYDAEKSLLFHRKPSGISISKCSHKIGWCVYFLHERYPIFSHFLTLGTPIERYRLRLYPCYSISLHFPANYWNKKKIKLSTAIHHPKHNSLNSLTRKFAIIFLWAKKKEYLSSQWIFFMFKKLLSNCRR